MDNINPKKKVLIVDDDLDLQNIIQSALDLEGYEVIVADNGKEALDILNNQEGENKVSCIILDLMMPVMDGTTMLNLLRGDPRFSKIPVIISTAKGVVDQKNIDNSQAVIKKPMKIDQLYDTVKKHTTH